MYLHVLVREVLGEIRGLTCMVMLPIMTTRDRVPVVCICGVCVCVCVCVRTHTHTHAARDRAPPRDYTGSCTCVLEDREWDGVLLTHTFEFDVQS